MTAAERMQRRLRAQAEHHLRVAAMKDLRARHPEGTAAPDHGRGGALWRVLFVPAYRRVPWEVKQKAMRSLGMTAESHGWTPPSRTPGEPWRPPPVQEP
jgi:hypothetical protein